MTEPRRSRASLLAWAADDVRHQAAVAERIERELPRLLAERLRAETLVVEAAQVGLAVLIAVLLWNEVSPALLAGLLSLVGLATLARLVAYRRLDRRRAAPAAIVRTIRWGVLSATLTWGVAAIVVVPQIPLAHAMLWVAVFIGVLAGGTSALVADPRSFYIAAVSLLAPLLVAVLLHGQSRVHVVAALLVAMLGVGAVLVLRRAHGVVMRQLRAAQQLDFGQREAARERGFLDALISGAPIAIATMDRLGRVRGVNPAFERLFGWSVDEVLGSSLNQLIVPEDEIDAARATDEQVRSGRTVVTEAERLARDGRRIAVRISAAPVPGVGEGTAFMLFDDLTAVTQAQRALAEAEEQYRALVESASDLVWQMDEKGRWSFVNEASARIYGVPAEDLLGRSLIEWSDAERKDADQAALNRLLAGEELRDYETVHRDGRGERKHLSFAARCIRDASGKVVGARGIARDVTERAASRKTLEEARDLAQRAAHTKAAFLANMSHEIRTPMNGILGMIELLLDTELTDEQRRSAELVRSSAEALLAVIHDVLDFSKIEAGHLELEHVVFDLSGLVDAAVQLLGVRAFEKGIRLAVDIQPDVPHSVRGDPGRLRQVLNNLVGNAIKFTPEGEVVVQVALEAQRDEHTALIRFSVRDTGVGIPADKREAIFGEFSQADVSTTRRFGGTGLGLAISRQLVRKMGGEIAVESAPGEGSEFSFSISLEAVAEPATAVGAEHLNIGALSGTRALLVDDNTTDRRIVRDVLQQAGVNVEEASSVEQALLRLRRAAGEQNPYRLAVIEAHLPERDGFQLAEAIRAAPDLRPTRLMMLSSIGRQGDGQRCRELGVSAYLTKPLARSLLLEAAAAVLQGPSPGLDTLVTRHSINETRQHLDILLAEDNPVNQQVAVAMLRKRGHRVEVVSNGREAVEALTQRRFDIVLMDLQMPELDGIAATREIRRMKHHASLPIIAVTAHAMAEERERCLAVGMNEVVVKPFKPHELFAAVEGWEFGKEEAAAGPPAGDGMPVNLDGLRAAMRESGVEDALESILETFVADAPGRMAAVEKAVSGDDAESVRQAAHAYKSAAGTIGATQLAALLKQLEQAGKDRDLEAARRLLPETRGAHDAVLLFLESAGPPRDGAHVD